MRKKRKGEEERIEERGGHPEREEERKEESRVCCILMAKADQYVLGSALSLQVPLETVAQWQSAADGSISSLLLA